MNGIVDSRTEQSFCKWCHQPEYRLLPARCLHDTLWMHRRQCQGKCLNLCSCLAIVFQVRVVGVTASEAAAQQTQSMQSSTSRGDM